MFICLFVCFFVVGVFDKQQISYIIIIIISNSSLLLLLLCTVTEHINRFIYLFEIACLRENNIIKIIITATTTFIKNINLFYENV